MVRSIGLATVTLGGGAAACFCPCPQPANTQVTAIAAAARARADDGMSLKLIMSNAAYFGRQDVDAHTSRAFVNATAALPPLARAPHILLHAPSPLINLR